MDTMNAALVEGAPKAVEGPAAWYGRDMAVSTEWIHELTAEDIQELDRAIAAFHAQGMSMADISPATFSLPKLSKKLEAILNEIIGGRGFVLLRGLPVERYGKGDSAIAYLGIGAHLGSFRS